MGDWVSVSGVRVRGPLAGYAVGFGEFLAVRGTRRGRFVCRCTWSRSSAGGWRPRVLSVGGLTELAAERFIAARRARVEAAVSLAAGA